MKINGHNRLNGINPYKKNIDKQEQAKATKKQDHVEISQHAKQMQVAQSFTTERQEKIAKLKKQVESGTYQVKPQEVAKKLYEFWRQ